MAFGKKFHSFKEFIEWIKDRWIMPGEFFGVLAKRNLHNTFVILHMIVLFGVTNFAFYAVRHFSELFDGYCLLKSIYYLLYVFPGILCLVLAYFIRRSKSEKSVLRNLPLIIMYCVMMILCVYNFHFINQTFSGVILYICIGIVSITFFNVPPSLFFLADILISVHALPFVYSEWHLSGVMDFLMISILIVFLSMFKWRITKRDLIKSELLEAHKEILTNEVDKQSQEIELQNDELQKQHERLISIQNNTIISLSNLVENRDSDTGEHVRRTSAYVNLLARKAFSNGYHKEFFNEKYVDLITRAAPMHDVGKIVVPDSVLKKPGKLTAEEFEQIKRHTVEGGRIVREIIGESDNQDYLDIAINIATSHHERWDGKGYPNGLAGEQIPVCARIMAIADVFDALVSPRCYKEPFPVDKAFEIIREEAGTHFDPVLAELFVNMQDDVVAIMSRYADKKN